MAFTHLHVHTEYSLLDGACRIEKLLDRAVEMGQASVAITDHGNMYGVIDFFKAAKKRGIKPIIGCEVYVAKRTRFDKVHGIDSENRHLVLLCENMTGYKNLIAMVSQAWTEGFYSKPRVDFELLEKHSEGLIALSACLAGEIPRALKMNDYEEAKEAALRYRSIFGKKNFFLELQDHGLAEQKQINPQIMKLSKDTGIELVVTNDSHYVMPEDSKMHHVLICIQTNRTVEDKDVLEFGSDEFYFKSEEEMRSLFPNCPQAADNTAKIAERCNVEFEFGKTKLPNFSTPDGSENDEFFRRKCFEGLYEIYGANPDGKAIERLEYEISVVEQMGYVNYYLIVYDFIRYAKSVNIPVGPGRGSGVGSLAAYCMGITGIDPLKYDLIFERFLNPERVSMPDFDIDFSDERRHEIIDYVVDKYGSDHVAQIVTFGTMAARAALRDVGRALAVPYAKVDVIAKLVPFDLNMTLDKAIQESKDFAQKYNTDDEIKELVDMAKKLEGMPRHASTHAAGVVITDKPVMEYVPLAKNDDSIVTQFTMTAIEELGLLKMDFLGLRYLSIIDNASKLVRSDNPEFSIDTIDVDDPKPYEMISAAATDGIFQLESGGMRRLLVQAAPKSIEDLTAVISLYRPGPMQFIPMYVQNRKNSAKVSYLHEKLRGILGVTYGCIIYQEQVMQIFRELAGYSLGRADIVRRAMSKKKHDVLERERQVFINGVLKEDSSVEIDGCVRRGVDAKTANVLFDEIENFASYAFAKSHAAAYALVAYQTAYLKCYYPSAYMAALLSSSLGMSSKVSEYIEECHRLNILVLPPHVNSSENNFIADGKCIRFGLLAVKNLGRAVIARLIEQRRADGEFTSFYNFCKRMQGRDINKRAVESLIKCGALDNLGSNRREMLLSLETVLDSLEADRRKNIDGQMGLFDSPEDSESGEIEIVKAADFSDNDKLAMEKEIIGLYLSGHPMKDYINLYKTGKFARIDEVFASAEGESDKHRDNEWVELLAIVTGLKKKTTKNNADMAFLTLEDMYGSIEALVFPNVLEQFGNLLAEGSRIAISGRISFTEEKEPKLICDSVRIAPNPNEADRAEPQKAPEKSSGRVGLYIKVDSQTDKKYEKALKYIDIFDGTSDLYVYYKDKSKLLKAPSQYKVAVNEVLINALRELLGAENVVYRS